MIRLDDRVAIITGGAAGIGIGIVERFLEAGARVASIDINAAGIQGQAERLNQPDRFLPIAGDVSNSSDVESAVAQTVGRFGRLDAVVSNAGIECISSVEAQTEAEWDRQIDVNLKAAFLLSKAAVPHMRASGGSIVSISSVHAYVSYPGFAGYDASKAGLLGLTRALALDLGQYKIRVNVICPGYINTALLEQWLATLPDHDAGMRQVLAVHPLGRIGVPRDIADAALFLSSEYASFITGASLVVDGGMTIAGH